MLKRLSYIIFILLAYSSSLAQKTGVSLVSGEFKNIRAEQFLLQLEAQTGFHFYFDASQLDSVTINISVNSQPLPQVLTLAFLNTGIGFSQMQNSCFISKGQVVQT